jgi:hypothetical protein
MTEIGQLMRRLGQEVESLVDNCLQLSWYSRGGWPYHTVLKMTAGERDLAFNFINKRMEAQAKSSYPVY